MRRLNCSPYKRLDATSALSLSPLIQAEEELSRSLILIQSENDLCLIYFWAVAELPKHTSSVQQVRSHRIKKPEGSRVEEADHRRDSSSRRSAEETRLGRSAGTKDPGGNLPSGILCSSWLFLPFGGTLVFILRWRS